MKRSTMLYLVCISWVCALVWGCWLTTDNPDAPYVVPPIGRPDNWPVYKTETNSVITTNNNRVVTNTVVNTYKLIKTELKK